MSEEEKQEFFRIPCLAYLIHLSLNKPEEHVEESMIQWRKELHPGRNIEKIQINDILKVLSLRKEALIRLLPFYTRDQKETIFLILQLENYHRKIEQKALAIYLNKNENKDHSLIEEVVEKYRGLFLCMICATENLPISTSK